MEPATEVWELWTWREVATALKVSRSWVYAKAGTGELPSLRVGGLLRFEPAAVHRFALATAGGKIVLLNTAAPAEN
ncbi:MAG TPA: helix-turn-helix domain-containing protein [Myxococcaceae bacterium]